MDVVLRVRRHVFVGQLVRGFTTCPLGEEGARNFYTAISRPTAVFYRDLLIHWDAWKGPTPIVECFASQAGEGMVFNEFSRLSGYGEIVDLGNNPDALSTDDVPHYAEMVRESLQRLGWNESEFRTFRFRWEYPILQSLVRTVFKR